MEENLNKFDFLVITANIGSLFEEVSVAITL